MKEAVARIIKDILSMVAYIQHRRRHLILSQSTYNTVENRISVADRIIIGIYKAGTVCLIGFGTDFWPENIEFIRIALMIIEMRTVAMKHNEQFTPVRSCEFLIELDHKLTVTMMTGIIA